MCRCGNENGILVAYGVDSEGEWETLECAECGKVWLERKEHGMKVEGYEIGTVPTEEEFRIFRKVKAHNDRLDVAMTLGEFERREMGERLTQDEFELLCHRFGKLDFNDSVWDAISWEYDEIIGERG